MMERRLRQAFDFQRFEGNARLQAVIDEAHARMDAYELADDELGFVSAAGVPEQEKPDDEKKR